MRRGFLLIGLLLAVPAFAGDLDPERLSRAWPKERFVPTAAPCLKEAELTVRLRELAARHKDLQLKELGRSVEDRPIYLMTLGRGPAKVLLWSQMHGDEPSATPALLDLADYLLRHRDDEDVARVFEKLTLLMVPMLNPDGAEEYERRNAQAIDLNRDALNVATPEGDLLKALRAQHEPILGFNLHDQNRRRTVGDTGVLAANAVLAVVGDKAKTVTPGRLLAMRAAVAVADALEHLAPGGLGRFDDTFSRRAFGDNLTKWGTPVLLIESGGVRPGQSLEELTRYNFVALGTVLGELAKDELARYDPARYALIPENNSDEYADVALKGGYVRQPGSKRIYRADVAFNRLVTDREAAGCVRRKPPRSEIVEVGDGSIFSAGEVVDARGGIVLAAFTIGADGWAARRFLDAAGLEQLGRLGVGRVRWIVGRRQLDAAQRHAEQVAGPGRPRIEVSTDRTTLPTRVLHHQPLAAGATLGDRLRSLEAAAGLRQPAPFEEALAALWPKGSRSTLRLDASASFTLYQPQTAGALDAGARVTRTWVEGIELRKLR